MFTAGIVARVFARSTSLTKSSRILQDWRPIYSARCRAGFCARVSRLASGRWASSAWRFCRRNTCTWPPIHDHLRAEVVHRHFAPHHAAAPQTHVENPDDDSTYLSSAFHGSRRRILASAPTHSCLVASQPEATAPGFTQWHRQARDLRAHDPPWACATGLRGPPQLLA